MGPDKLSWRHMSEYKVPGDVLDRPMNIGAESHASGTRQQGRAVTSFLQEADRIPGVLSWEHGIVQAGCQ